MNRAEISMNKSMEEYLEYVMDKRWRNSCWTFEKNQQFNWRLEE